MKELSMQEKARRYDEAIKLVNSKWYYKNQPCIIDVSEIFPELKDENETIRKELINFINSHLAGFPQCEKYIAWIEKQINDEDIHLLKLKAKAYDDSKARMSNAYDANRVPLSFANEIFPNLKSYENRDKTNVTQYCCILDFNTGKVFKHCITEDEANLNTADLLRKYGFKESECSVMYTSNNLELKLLED